MTDLALVQALADAGPTPYGAIGALARRLGRTSNQVSMQLSIARGHRIRSRGSYIRHGK